MRRLRPLLFWLFVGFFFCTTSGVLFYTFGYRFNFERGIFIYSGSISIKSSPETVDIRVDNELIPQKKLGILNRSIHIGGLTPGEHFVEVSAPGYTSWSKKTTVQSGLSTEFWNVFLVKQNNTPEVITGTAGTLKVFQAREQGLLALAEKKNGLFTVNILDTNTKTSEQVFSLSDASLPADGEENIEWSPDDKKVLIPLEQGDFHTYYIVDIASKQVLSLNELTQSKGKEDSIRNPRWDPANRNFLLYLKGTTLNRIDTGTTDALPLFVKENVRDYNFSGQDTYYLSNDNGIIYRIFGSSTDTEPLQVTTLSIDMLPDSLYTLILYDDARLTVREQKTGKLWVYNKLSSSEIIFRTIAERDVRGIQFSDDGKKLLFFTGNEISVYFLRDWEAQPLREHDTIIQIARFSNTIKNVVWAEDYEHILFSLGNNAKIIELDNRDRRNMADLATFSSPLLQILPRFDENYVYFVTSQSEEADAVSRTLFSEETGLFGF
jgi:Tol biopolymer transport system component